MSDWWSNDPVAGGGATATPSGRPQITPTQRSFLNAMAAGESPDYNTMYGGGRFEELRDHPRQAVPIRSGPNAGRTSSAAGKYQFLAPTWDEAQRELGLPDFSPDSQDAAATWLAERDYGKRTKGRNLWEDIDGAKDNPSKLNFIGGALSKTWTSLPGGIERNSATAGFGQRLAGDFSAQSRQPMQILPETGAQPSQEANWWANDPVAGAQPAPQANVPLPRPAPSSRNPEGPPQAPRSMLQQALSPITTYPDTYNQMRQEAQDQSGRGGSQIATAARGEDIMGYPMSAGDRAWEATKGVGNALGGGIGYVASPINAALRTFAGKPVEDATGIPKEYTEFATSLAVPGLGMTRVSAAQAPARVLRPGEQVAQSADNLSGIGQGGAVEVPRAVASDSMAAQRIASTVRNVPLAGDPIVKATERTVQQLGQKVDDVAREYGSGSVVTAGDTAKTAITDWIGKGSEKKVDYLYKRVDQHINPAITTDMVETRNIANSISSARQAATLPEGKAVAQVLDAITSPNGLTYDGLKKLRTSIGEMQSSGILPEGMSAGELKQIYGALSKDLGVAVKNAGGPQAEAAFNRANKYYSLVSDRRESLAKIVGADGNAPAEKVFDNLVTMASGGSRADIARLAQARKVMQPDEWNEVASGVISRMGKLEDVHGEILFSPQKFLTAYQDKMTKPGRELLFRSGGKQDIAPYLNDIAAISGRFRELQKFANPSGSGQAVSGVGFGAGFMVAPMTTIATVVGGNVVARILASPVTVAPAAQWSRKYEIAVRSPTPANVAQLTIASRNLANTVNSELGLSVNWQDFLKTMQGAVPARADKENR